MQQILITFVLFLMRGTVSSYLYDYDNEEPDYEEPVHTPKILSSSHFLEAVAGENVIFPCEVEDLGDFVLLWKREKNRVLFAGDLKIIRDDRIQTDGTSLQITSVQATDSGEYTCQTTTNPPLELVHTLDVLYPPSIKAKPSEAYVAAKEGETVTLMCEATGNPVPEITWKYAGRHFDSSNNNSYVVANAQKSDSGEYECIADNHVGEPAATTITLKILSAPKVDIEPQSGLIVVKEGEPISIGCNATGDPTPFITLKKPNGERMIKTSDVNIAEASKADAGIYECIANNAFGITTSAVIRVQVLYPPRVQMLQSKVYAKQDKSVNISCIVEGEPSPVITWKNKREYGKAEVAILPNKKYHFDTSGHSHMLIIHDTNERDFGEYECTASNSLSSVTGTTHLTGEPQVPVFTSKPKSNQERSYTISWTVNSDPPVEEYLLIYRAKLENAEWVFKWVPATEEDDKGMHTEVLQLVELQPGTEYEAQVEARNEYGSSEKSKLVFKTKNEDVTSTSTTTETTETPTISEHHVSAAEENHSENYSSSSTRLSFSLNSLLIYDAYTLLIHYSYIACLMICML